MTVEQQATRGRRTTELSTGEDTSSELSIVDSLAPVRNSVNQADTNAMVAAMNAAVLDTTDPNFIRAQIDTLGSTAFDRINRERSITAVTNSFNQEINEAIENQQIDRLVKAEAERQKAVETITKTASPEAFTASLSNPETENRIAEAKFNSRLVTLSKLINEIVEKDTPGIIGGIGEFADLFISAPFDALKLGGFTRTEDAQHIANLMAADIPEDQFEAEARAAITRAKDAGVFTDSNIFFLLSMVENINQRGKGTEAQLDRFFNVLDLAGIGGAAVEGSAKMLRAARTGTSLASSLGGPRAGARVLADAAADPDNPDKGKAAGIGRESMPSVMRHPENYNNHKSWTAPGVEISARIRDEDSYLNYVRSLNFSQRIDPQVFEQWKPTGLQRLREDIAAEKHSRIIDLDIDQDDAGNLYGVILFGKKNGMPFTDKGNATKAARQLNGQLESVPDLKSPVTEDTALGGQNFYFVRMEKNISAQGLADPLTNEEIGRVYYGMLDDAKLLGGSFLSIPKRLDSLAKRGEGVFSRATKDIGKRLQKKVKATPVEDRKVVERMLFELRDGEHAWRRDAFNEGEFISEFAKISGRQPSQAAIDMYFDVQEVNDSFYLLKADQLFKKAVDKGYDEVVQFDMARADGTVDNYNIVSKKISPEQMTEGDVAFNPISGEQFTKDLINRNHTVFRLADEFDHGQDEFRFLVFEQPRTRRLYHTDVLGYNPGGPRQYENLKFTIKQEKPGARPRTLMGAETSVQAEKGMNQINNILIAARDKVGNVSSLSRAQAIDAIDDLGDDLNDIIRANNEFDPSIETGGEFAEFLRGQRVDPRQNVGMARLNTPVLTEDDAGELMHLGGDTYQEILEGGLNQPTSVGPRRDVPLRGYGNNMLETKSPIETIQNDYMRVLHDKAFGAFNFQAVNGWLKGAKNLIANQDQIAGMNPMRAMNEAKFIDEDLPAARNFKAARAAINRVMNTKTGYEKAWDSLMDRTVDFVFQKGFKKTGKVIDKNARDPATALRGYSFDARLGMLDPSQLLVQSSQTFNILAIMGLKRFPEFLRAAATHVPVRIAVERIDNPQLIREIGRRTQAFTGMDPDEFVEFTQWVHNSGRLEIGGEVAELSNMSPVATKGFVGKLRDKARVFFNEGEKMPRSVALRVAWNEYKREFPRADINSEHAVQWITGRQDSLFAAMTRASRSELQRGPQSIPFQFFTYIQRMQESLFTNRLLTTAERKRLAIAQFFFWGTAGAGIGSITVDSAVNEGKVLGVKIFDSGVTLNEFEYTTMRYGLLNAVVNEAVGTQRVAFGERLAPAAGVADFIKKISDNNFRELMGGPSVDLVADVWQRLPYVFSSMVSGNTTMVVEDFHQMMRNISSYNRGYQAWYIAQYGDYVSKNNNKVVSGLTNSDALMVAIGNQVQDANLAYDRAQMLAGQRDSLKTHQRRIEEMVAAMELAIEEDRPEDAEAIGDAIGKELAILKPYQFQQVFRGLSPQVESLAEEMFHKVRMQGFEQAGRINRDDE